MLTDRQNPSTIYLISESHNTTLVNTTLVAVVLLTTLGVLKVVADVQDGQPLWGFSLGTFVCNNGTATNSTSTRR